jgi:ABC-2 type transport system permease protein
MGTLVRRSFGRVAVLFGALIGILVAFQAALIAIAASFEGRMDFERLVALAPPAVRGMMGPALSSFAGMATLGFFEPLPVMIVVQFAIYLATEPAGEIESGLVDLILARPLPRHRLITRSLVVMSLAICVLSLAMAATTGIALLTLAPAGARWPERSTIVTLMAHLAAVGWCFGGVGLASAAWSRRRGAAQALVSVAAVTLYLLDVVAEAWPRVRGLGRLTPFHYFHGAAILTGTADVAGDLSVLLAIGLAATGLAYWQFHRRDL